jgi:hypothetical protein
MLYMFPPHRVIFRKEYKEHALTQDTNNQRSGTPNGAQSGRKEKDSKNKHPITPELIITTTCISSTI